MRNVMKADTLERRFPLLAFRARMHRQQGRGHKR